MTKVLSDAIYESITANVPSVPGVPSKQYYYKNDSGGALTVTYGGNVETLQDGDLLILMYDGVSWTNLTPRVEDGDVTLGSLVVNGNITQTAGVTSLKATTVDGTLAVVGSSATSGFLDTNGYVFTLGRNSFDNYINSNGALTINTAGRTGLSQVQVKFHTNGNTSFGSSTDNGTDLLQVGSDTNISASIGRAKIVGLASGSYYMSQYSYASPTTYNLAGTLAGATYVNALSGQEVRILNNNLIVATFAEDKIDLVNPVEVTDHLAVKSGTLSFPVFSGAYLQADSAAKVYLSSAGDIAIMMDSNNNSTNTHFDIMTNGDSPTTIASFYEHGRVTLGATDNLTDKLQVNGSAANTTGVWATLSDIRLKENFSPITNALDKVNFLATKIKHFEFKEGATGHELGYRTGIVIDDELTERFKGHITEVPPANEQEGIYLGWEYTDEEYTEEVPLTETKVEVTYEIQQDKDNNDFVAEISKEVEVPVMETYFEKEIQDEKEIIIEEVVTEDEEGNPVVEEVEKEVLTGKKIIVEVEKQRQKTETVTKTRRVPIKEGSKARQLENSFFQYLFPAVKELSDENKELKERLLVLEAKLGVK